MWVPNLYRENIRYIHTKGPIVCAIKENNEIICWIAYEKNSDILITDNLA